MKKMECAAANQAMPARVGFALPAYPSPAAGKTIRAFMSQTTTRYTKPLTVVLHGIVGSSTNA
jgi:predicted alpha/beta-fold hydrolase